jgi:hypothetical protein
MTVGLPEPNPAVTSRSSHAPTDQESLVAFCGIGSFDVLCGRDKNAFNNAGNRRFRDLVSQSLECYMQASSRTEKSTVIRSVVERVRHLGGRFLQEDRSTHRCIELDDKKAHEKTGHALRDMALLRGTRRATTKSRSSLPPRCSPTTTATLSSSVSLRTDTTRKSSPPSLIDELDLPVDQTLRTYPQSTYCRMEEQWEDAASDVSFDESAFDDLIQSMAETTDSMAMERRLTPPAMVLLPVVSDDLYHKNGELTAFRHEKRTSTNSIVVDDHILSWLVGEIDFVCGGSEA